MPPIPEAVCNHPDAANRDLAKSDPEIVTPIVRVPPIYPPRAAKRGVQGWVCLDFTITKSGTVSDASVISSSPEGYFEESTLVAIQQWRYRQRQGPDGPVDRPGIRVMLKFEIAP
jgi:protein TonB